MFDKKRGNLITLAGDGRVAIAFHGLRALPDPTALYADDEGLADLKQAAECVRTGVFHPNFGID